MLQQSSDSYLFTKSSDIQKQLGCKKCDTNQKHTYMKKVTSSVDEVSFHIKGFGRTFLFAMLLLIGFALFYTQGVFV